MGLNVVSWIGNVTSDKVGLFTNSSPRNTFSITINHKSRPQTQVVLKLEKMKFSYPLPLVGEEGAEPSGALEVAFLFD